MKILVPVVATGIVLTVVTCAIAVTTLVKVNKGFNDIQSSSDGPPLGTTITPPVTTSSSTRQTTMTTTTTTTTSPTFTALLPQLIRIQDVIAHLDAFQRIASESNGNRAIHTVGFNRTVDYIDETLRKATNYTITRRPFDVKLFQLVGTPIFTSSIDGVMKNYTYDSTSRADFVVAEFTTSISYSEELELAVIPNLGCTDADWLAANPPADGRAALVKRGECTFLRKAALAAQYNATALLIYNSGVALDGMRPIGINLGENNTLVALSLSHQVGQQLAMDAENGTKNVSVFLDVNAPNAVPLPVENICADTRTGNINQTILIGSHSDSVMEGPGINDDGQSYVDDFLRKVYLSSISGSGSAANLQLAIGLYQLFQTPNYQPFDYRVRFCWWAAEEVGLLGSDYHVKQALIATEPGERLQDHLINLNYDMLGSRNFVFGIYDDQSVENSTPNHTRPGNKKISDLFRRWFDEQRLPWSDASFDGRSDYGPFLAAGTVAGGVSTGAEEKKSQIERDRYELLLGQGLAGLVNVSYDSCYHQACDSIHNIDGFAYATMVQAAAYVLERLGQESDLEGWLYPDGRPSLADSRSSQRLYNSVNEYFRLPYL